MPEVAYNDIHAVEVDTIIDEHGYSTAGKLPRNNTIVRNIASGFAWHKYLRTRQRGPFLELYADVWRAFRRMNNGKFTNLWRS